MTARVNKQTTTVKQDIIFSDFFNDFTKHPFSTSLSIIKNENSVKQALKNIIFTNFNERLYNPNFGGNINNFLFEPMNNFTYDAMKESIQNTIQNYEPRVVDSNIVITPIDEFNSIKINIYFTLLNSNQVSDLEIILKRVR